MRLAVSSVEQGFAEVAACLPPPLLPVAALTRLGRLLLFAL